MADGYRATEDMDVVSTASFAVRARAVLHRYPKGSTFLDVRRPGP